MSNFSDNDGDSVNNILKVARDISEQPQNMEANYRYIVHKYTKSILAREQTMVYKLYTNFCEQESFNIILLNNLVEEIHRLLSNLIGIQEGLSEDISDTHFAKIVTEINQLNADLGLEMENNCWDEELQRNLEDTPKFVENIICRFKENEMLLVGLGILRE